MARSASRVPAYLQVARVLRERIARAQYRAGEYLPSERELAREFGVNRKTIRLATGDLCREGLLLPELRRGYRVTAPIEASGTPSTGLAALVIYDMTRGSSAIMFRGCQRAVQESGYHLIVCETWQGPERSQNSEAEHLRRLIDRRVDGILLYAEPSGENRSLVEEALAAGIAVVQLDRFIPGLDCDYVGVDNVGGVVDVVRHLREQGHRRIALLTNHPPATAVLERMEGYRRGLADVGLPVNEELVGSVPRGRPVLPVYREVVRRWLDLPEPPTAVVAVNDEMAYHTIEALRAEGREVPTDIAVAGFDNQPLATLTRPPLTTVAQPFLHLGEIAAQMLLDRITGRYRGSARRLILPTQLIVRESTAVPAPATR